MILLLGVPISTAFIVSYFKGKLLYGTTGKDLSHLACSDRHLVSDNTGLSDLLGIHPSLDLPVLSPLAW